MGEVSVIFFIILAIALALCHPGFKIFCKSAWIRLRDGRGRVAVLEAYLIETLAMLLALVVSATDNKMADCEIELIKKWAAENIDLSQANNDIKRHFEKFFAETIVFFRKGCKVNIYKICKKIVELAPLADRYEILNLCVSVAAANGLATRKEVTILKNLSKWLELDQQRFHLSMERILPAQLYQEKDKEIILGITSDMNKEQARNQLNNEYRKWHARITNSHTPVQVQANYMLNYIAQARNEYLN
ncbi:MAG: TerB family tellurite resistance protein [Planctomycetota bacterium]|jgi:tellurite resistance protein